MPVTRVRDWVIENRCLTSIPYRAYAVHRAAYQASGIRPSLARRVLDDMLVPYSAPELADGVVCPPVEICSF